MNDSVDMIEILHRFVPASHDIIQDRFSLTADNFFQSLDAEGIKFEINRLTDGDWDLEVVSLTDKDIFDKMRFDEAMYSGNLLIHTAACSRYGLDDFICNSESLEDFILEYKIEMFFDGDVIIVCEKGKMITVYHHEGVFTHIKL